MGVACHPAQWQASKQLNDLLAASVADINEHQLVAAEIDGPKYTTSVPLIIPLSFFLLTCLSRSLRPTEGSALNSGRFFLRNEKLISALDSSRPIHFIKWRP